MKLISTTIATSVWLLLAACGGPDVEATIPQAEPAEASSIDIGDYIVHFSAQLTDQLPPEVARLYNIVRSKNRVMLNVSVIEETSGNGVPADVSVKTVNLTGQLKTVNMRKLEEQEAIYYVGETPIANRETLVFDITVGVEGIEEPAKMRFKRQFFTDH
ncbi:MAG: DUF4426 domain-containing protein [Woeseiaceae bacterium]